MKRFLILLFLLLAALYSSACSCATTSPLTADGLKRKGYVESRKVK